VRGFSPTRAGNIRIEGLYFDQVWGLTGRIRRSTTIRVGLSAFGFDFPAPTGIVDYSFRKPDDSAALAALIAAGPLATIAGAAWLRSDAEKVATGLESQLSPRRAAEQEREKARVLLGAAITQPGPAALLDQVSAALPPEDSLARAERAEDGRLEIDVATSDPDALRGAMRRQPALAGLRDVRQREGEGRTLVLFRQSAR